MAAPGFDLRRSKRLAIGAASQCTNPLARDADSVSACANVIGADRFARGRASQKPKQYPTWADRFPRTDVASRITDDRLNTIAIKLCAPWQSGLDIDF